jgi:prephenate dehydratase
MITALYQGVEGAYSDVLLRRHFGARGEEVETVGLPTFRDVAVALLAGRGRYAILPLENTVAGTFRDGYDLVAQYDLTPVREVIFRMDHRLLGVPGATVAGLTRIEAHPMVLEECGRFLATLPGARPVPALDTGVAARDVAEAKDPAVAAIAPAEAAVRYGLVELCANVGDHPDNITRFLLVEAAKGDERTRSEGGTRRTSVLFATAHEHGVLARCLAVLADAGVNLTKLESRPKPGRPWEYLFYADFDGDADDPAIAAALSAMRARCTELRLLGSYDADRSKMGDPLRVPQTPPARPGPPPAALKGSEIPPVIAGATPDAAVFAKVYRAADISEAEQERVEKTLNLLQSLPAETPREVKKQIVEASLKAFGIPVDQIIQAGAQEIQALDAYIKHGEQHTQEVLADASARVAKLEAEIGEVRRLMDLQVQTQLGLTRATTNEKLRVQAVLEFFEPR